jgi:lipopolysaccharide transport system ATP-binding protein
MLPPRIVLEAVWKIFPVSGALSGDLFPTTDPLGSEHGKVAVDSVNLIIEQGTRLGIVGRNGAGKSTLLHLIAGLTSPTLGSVTVDGKVTSIMTLGLGLREHLSGRENIYIDGEMQGRNREEIEEVIDQIIEFSELGEFINYPMRTYSSGMKARLAFSMISYIDPEILIIDEALSVGDASFSKKATEKIYEICEKGKIVIVVSHSMASVRAICNRCLWIDNGKIIMDGKPDEVTRAYIDAVRSIDETALIEKFSRHIGIRSLAPDWVIQEVALFSGNDEVHRLLIEAGRRLRINIRATLPPDNLSAIARVRVIRVDDLLLFEEVFLACEYRLDLGAIGLEVEMQSLMLGAAIYRLDVTLENGDCIAAEASTIFEVYTQNPPIGGKPMLLCRPDVRISPA